MQKFGLNGTLKFFLPAAAKGVEELISATPRPSGVPSSEGTESTCRSGVCTTTG